MLPQLLNQIERAEQFERNLERLETDARARWLRFWKWLAVAVVCLGVFVVGFLIGRALP